MVYMNKKSKNKKALEIMRRLEKTAGKYSISLSDVKKWKTIENVVKHKKFIPSIGPIKRKIIENLIKKHKPKKILEIGTLFGYSAILMARLLLPKGQVVTIEKNKDNARIAKENIADAGLRKNIKIISGDALEIIPKIIEKFDILFIDAKKSDYLNYLKLAEKNLKQGSLVIADNTGIFKKQLSDYLIYVRNPDNYNSKTIKTFVEFSKDIEDAIEVSVMLNKQKLK